MNRWVTLLAISCCLAAGQLLIGFQSLGNSIDQMVLGNAYSSNPLSPLSNCKLVDLGFENFIGMSEYDPNLHIYAITNFDSQITFVYVDLGCITWTYNFGGEGYYRVLATTFWPGKCIALVLLQDFASGGTYTVWGIHACDAFAPPQQFAQLAIGAYNLPDINALAFDGNNVYVVGQYQQVLAFNLFNGVLTGQYSGNASASISKMAYANGVVYATGAFEQVISVQISTGTVSLVAPSPCDDDGSGYRNNVAFDMVNMVAYQNLLNCANQNQLFIINLYNGETQTVTNGPFSPVLGISVI